jgi:hypothetical protein
MKRHDQALQDLERATLFDPENARFAYVQAAALHSTGKAIQRSQNRKKRSWLIPTTAIFSPPWQVFTKRAAKTPRRVVTPSG